MSRMIKVILWGEEVGRLLWDERRHLSYFTFNPDFLSKGIDIAEASPFHSGFSAG